MGIYACTLCLRSVLTQPTTTLVFIMTILVKKTSKLSSHILNLRIFSLQQIYTTRSLQYVQIHSMGIITRIREFIVGAQGDRNCNHSIAYDMFPKKNAPICGRGVSLITGKMLPGSYTSNVAFFPNEINHFVGCYV